MVTSPDPALSRSDGLTYETTIPDPPADPTVCPVDGGDHEPEFEDASFSGNFWGQPVLENHVIANCSKCGMALEVPLPDPPDRYDE